MCVVAFAQRKLKNNMTQYCPKTRPSKKWPESPDSRDIFFSSSIKWGKKKQQHSSMTPIFQSHIAVTFAYHYTSNMHACIQHILSLFQPPIHTLNYSHSVWQMWTCCIYTAFFLFFARAAPHLQVDKDCLHFLWTQDLLQWDHVVLETREIYGEYRFFF